MMREIYQRGAVSIRKRETYGGRLAENDAVALDEAEPAPHIGRELGEGTIDDGEEEDRIGRVQSLEQSLDGRLDGITDARTPGDERRDEEDGRLMALGFDKELHAGGLHGARRVGDEGSEIEGLDVEAFEVVQDGCADVALAHAGFAADEHARAEDSERLEGCSVSSRSAIVRLTEMEGQRTLKHPLLLESSSIVFPLGLLENVDALDLGKNLGECDLSLLETVLEERDELGRDGRSRRRSRASRRRDEVCERASEGERSAREYEGRGEIVETTHSSARRQSRER